MNETITTTKNHEDYLTIASVLNVHQRIMVRIALDSEIRRFDGLIADAMNVMPDSEKRQEIVEYWRKLKNMAIDTQKVF